MTGADITIHWARANILPALTGSRCRTRDKKMKADGRLNTEQMIGRGEKLQCVPMWGNRIPRKTGSGVSAL